MKVLGYVRRSTDRQSISVEVQVQQLHDAAELLGWGEMEVRIEDAASGGSMKKRPALAQALADLKAGNAQALAVSKLDRLSRSVLDTATLLNAAQAEGWRILCLNTNIDTTTAAGRAMAQMMAVFAEIEREHIRDRTREALANLKAQGRVLGRPSHIPVETVERIVALNASGLSASAIARLLNAEGVSKGPATTSQLWHHSHVVAAVRREQVRAGGTQR